MKIPAEFLKNINIILKFLGKINKNLSQNER